MERECLPASLRKCCLALHQGSLCKRGTRVTTSSLCRPATAAAPPLNTLFFSPCAVFAAWVTAFLADTEHRAAAAAGGSALCRCGAGVDAGPPPPPLWGCWGGSCPCPALLLLLPAPRDKSQGKEGQRQSRGRAGGCSISSPVTRGPAHQEQPGAWQGLVGGKGLQPPGGTAPTPSHSERGHPTTLPSKAMGVSDLLLVKCQQTP